MRSLRARLFVTTAIVLAVATLAAGLLSRRATLVEERQIVGPGRPPALDRLIDDAQRAYARDGVDGLRAALVSGSQAHAVRFIAIDGHRQPIAASTPELEQGHVKAAEAEGRLSLEAGPAEARSSIELRGVPTFAIRGGEG